MRSPDSRSGKRTADGPEKAEGREFDSRRSMIFLQRKFARLSRAEGIFEPATWYPTDELQHNR